MDVSDLWTTGVVFVVLALVLGGCDSTGEEPSRDMGNCSVLSNGVVQCGFFSAPCIGSGCPISSLDVDRMTKSSPELMNIVISNEIYGLNGSFFDEQTLLVDGDSLEFQPSATGGSYQLRANAEQQKIIRNADSLVLPVSASRFDLSKAISRAQEIDELWTDQN